MSLFTGLVSVLDNSSGSSIYKTRVLMGVVEHMKARCLQEGGPMAEHLIRSLTPILNPDSPEKAEDQECPH